MISELTCLCHFLDNIMQAEFDTTVQTMALKWGLLQFNNGGVILTIKRMVLCLCYYKKYLTDSN